MSYPQTNSRIVTGSINSVAAGDPVIVHGDFNMTLTGPFSASISLERSFDGVTYIPLTALGTAITFSGPATEIFGEPEEGVAYRINVTAFTSGTVHYRISQ